MTVLSLVGGSMTRLSERLQTRSVGQAFLTMAEVTNQPLTLKEARRSRDWPVWDQAIR